MQAIRRPISQESELKLAFLKLLPPPVDILPRFDYQRYQPPFTTSEQNYQPGEINRVYLLKDALGKLASKQHR